MIATGTDGVILNLVFLDLETSCLDHTAPEAALLEIALVAVDVRTLTEVAHWDTPIAARCHTGEWHPRVVEMHQDSGLLAELRGPRAMLKFEAGGLPTLEQAEGVALQFMAQFAPNQSSPMCGANVGSFDRQWLRRFMPRLDQAFHYRCLESNSFWMITAFATGQTFKDKATEHRALADARASVQAIRRFFGVQDNGVAAPAGP